MGQVFSKRYASNPYVLYQKNVQFNMQVFMKCMLWSICLLKIHEILGG